MRNLPAEQHPYCVPTAPGKDRMDIPDPDPQHAPLHEVHLFEILRHRYLEQARAVANIDVYDLILPTQTASVFDQAQNASQGVLTLAGQMCFPWRPKSKKSVQFGDHAYVQFDGTNLKRRWVTAPTKKPRRHTLEIHTDCECKSRCSGTRPLCAIYGLATSHAKNIQNCSQNQPD